MPMENVKETNLFDAFFKGEEGWTKEQLVASFDPGRYTGGVFGFYKYNTSTKQIELTLTRFDTLILQLENSAKKRYDPEVWSKQIYMWLTEHSKRLNTAQCIVEKQIFVPPITVHTTELHCIQCMLLTSLNFVGGAPFLIDSKSYKNAMGLSKGSHTTNKQAALANAKKVLGDKDYDKFVGGNHHVADAINQLCFQVKQWVEDHTKCNYEIVVKVDVKK